MREVTVFIGATANLIDPDLEPMVYDGHLDESEVLSIATSVGSVNNGAMSYNAVAIGGNKDDGWIITYHKDKNATPIPHPDGGHYYNNMGTGRVSFRVTHTFIHEHK